MLRILKKMAELIEKLQYFFISESLFRRMSFGKLHSSNLCCEWMRLVFSLPTFCTAQFILPEPPPHPPTPPDPAPCYWCAAGAAQLLLPCDASNKLSCGSRGRGGTRAVISGNEAGGKPTGPTGTPGGLGGPRRCLANLWASTCGCLDHSLQPTHLVSKGIHSISIILFWFEF